MAKKAFQILVGFLLGGFAAQFIALFLILMFHTWQGDMTLSVFLHLSKWERAFLILTPIVGAVLLWRRRRFVSIGMLVFAAFAWMLTARP